MAETYNEIALIFSSDAMDSVLFYARQGIPFAQKTKDYKTLARLYDFSILAFSFKSEFDSALVYLDKNTEIARLLNDKTIEGENCFGYGYVYARQGKYVTALDYYFKHLDFAEKNGVSRPDLMVRNYGNIGEINRHLHNYEQAIYWLERGIRYAKEHDCDIASKNHEDNFRTKSCYLQLGTVYYEIGQPDKALEYILQTDCAKARTIEDSYGLTTLARICLKEKDFEKALEYAVDALKPALSINDRQACVNVWTTFSEIYSAMGDYRRAEMEAMQAWQADTANIDDNRAVTYLLAQAHLHLGNTERADYFLRKNAELNKLYSEKSMHIALSDMEIKYHIDEKNLHITHLEKDKKNLYLLLMVGSIVLLLAIVALFSIYIVIKQRRCLAEKEKELAASDAALIAEAKERTRIGRDLHDSLGGMLSAVRLNLGNIEQLQNARNILDRSIDELRRIARGLMSETLLFSGLKTSLKDFCLMIPNVRFHHFGDDTRMNSKIETLTYLCAVELINNAIKHSNAESITVQLVQDSDRLSLSVQDDGCGFNPQTVVEGMGLHNLRTRIAACGGIIEISSAPGKGTEAFIEIEGLEIQKPDLQM
jgi:signal transduction histidine kinase